MTARPTTDIEARKAPGWFETALITSAVVVVALIFARYMMRSGEIADFAMTAQCRADIMGAVVAQALTQWSTTAPEHAADIEPHLQQLRDLTGGRTPKQIAALPQCQP